MVYGEGRPTVGSRPMGQVGQVALPERAAIVYVHGNQVVRAGHKASTIDDQRCWCPEMAAYDLSGAEAAEPECLEW